MAEEKKRRAEFKEFQKKLKESREAILLARRGTNVGGGRNGNEEEGPGKTADNPNDTTQLHDDDDTKTLKGGKQVGKGGPAKKKK